MLPGWMSLGAPGGASWALMGKAAHHMKPTRHGASQPGEQPRFTVAICQKPCAYHTCMRHLFFLAMATVSLGAAQTPSLSDIRQLTHGGQNAEAYWSPD